MFNFFKGMRQKLDQSLQLSPPQPVYKQYTHSQLKIIAMRTRMILQQLYNRQKQKITQKDSEFKKLQSNLSPINQQYEVLQQIGKKVIQVQSIKLYIQFLRKIQSYAPQIINKKGDISLLKNELSWFQCILWFRKCKKLTNIEQFNIFCNNFFKGVDITQQLNVNCQLFKVYQQLRYLGQDEIVPIKYLIEKITPFVSFAISQDELEQIKLINQKEIKQREQRQKEMKEKQRRAIFGGTELGQNSNNNVVNMNTGVVNPFDVIGRRLTGGGGQQQQQQQQQHQFYPQQPYQQPQQQQYNNPPHPYSLPNYNIDSSQIPFLPQPHQQTTNKSQSIDDEFAIDRFSRNPYQPSTPGQYSPLQTQQHPSPYQHLQQPQPTSISTSKQKSFKSSKLNLIDWQSMYGGVNKTNQQQQQHNPYINSSKIGLLNNNDQYSYSSSSNQYDAASLPYPPSGVIPISQIKYQPDHKFFVDTLQKYQSQPVISYNDIGDNIINKNGYDDGKNKKEEDSFIRGIQGEFFSSGGFNNNNQKFNKKLQPYAELSEQQLLLKQIQNTNKQHEQLQKQQATTPKSFNRLFGTRMKSNLSKQQQHSNLNILPQSQSKSQQQQQFPHLDLIQFIQSKMPQQQKNNNNNKQNQLKQLKQLEQQQQSIVKKLQQDDIEQYLRQHHYYGDDKSINTNNNTNNTNPEFNIDKQLDQLHINESSNYQSTEIIRQDDKNIDQDIISLIKTHKQDIKKQSYRRRHSSSQHQDHDKKKQQQHTHLQYPVDNQRIDSSTLRFSQQALFDNKTQQTKQNNRQKFDHTNMSQYQQEQHQQADYIGLENDLIDSLNIIRRHFGQDFVTNVPAQQQTDKNPQDSASTPKGIKKPYMVSIYARQDYLDSVKQSKKGQNSY